MRLPFAGMFGKAFRRLSGRTAHDLPCLCYGVAAQRGFAGPETGAAGEAFLSSALPAGADSGFSGANSGYFPFVTGESPLAGGKGLC